MDGGPFRVPQSPERRPASPRQSSPQRSSRPSVQKPAATKEGPAPMSGSPRSSLGQQKPTFLRRFAAPVAIGLLMFALGAIGAWAVSAYVDHNGIPALDDSRYQAVSLANGQTYFGKLTSDGGDYVVLRDIYYLQEQAPQSSTDSDSGSSAASNATAQLTKRGDAVYGPEDEMIISRDQIFFVENLKKDSAVVQLIKEYQQSE